MVDGAVWVSADGPSGSCSFAIDDDGHLRRVAGRAGFGVLVLIRGHIHYGVLVAGEGFGLPLLGVAEGCLYLHQLRPRKYLAADVLVQLDVVASPVQALVAASYVRKEGSVETLTKLYASTEPDCSRGRFLFSRVALGLTSWQATTFLIGEYGEGELHDNPVFTVADGLFWLYQQVERNSVVRKLHIMKLRGQSSVPGLHTFRITNGGLQAFSRTLGLIGKKKKAAERRRLSTGSPVLDEMMGGGIPEGDSVLVEGSSGTGKSLLATQFIMAGLKAGEPGIIAVFEERPNEYIDRAHTFGLDLKASIDDGKLEVIYLRPLDLSVDEMMQELIDAVERTGAKRLVIDSLAGFEMTLAPGFRTDFRESLYRMIFGLTGVGVTILSTLEMEETFDKLPFSSYLVSFLKDDIIRMRYVEIESQLRKLLMVVKMRGGLHSKDIREYEISSQGISIGERLAHYVRLLTGIPERVNASNSDTSRDGETKKQA